MKADSFSKPLVASILTLAFITITPPLFANPTLSAPTLPEPVAQGPADQETILSRLTQAGLLGSGSVSGGQIDNKTSWAEFSAIVSTMLSHPGILPPGTSSKTVDEATLKELLSASGQKALVARAIEAIRANPEQAAYLAGLYALLLKPSYVNDLAEGISKLFAESSVIRAAAPEIARALTIAIEGKQSYSLDARARAIGEAVSTLIYNLDPLKEDRHQLVIDAAIASVSFRPKINYTETIVEIILRTARGIGFPDEYLTALVTGISGNLGNVAGLQIPLNTVLGQFQGELSSPSRGNVVPQETPVVNN